MLTDEQEARYASLLDTLRAMDRVLIAFSGGVDSTLLLHAARVALADRVLAVTFVMPYTPAKDVEEARTMARLFGLELRIVEHPMPDVLRRNPPERCYLCKRLLFGRLMDMARDAGIEHVLDGSNVDDRHDYRPGRRAVEELGIVSPLLDVGMTKRDIRDISRNCDLPTWNRPAGACLLTRLPHDTSVDEDALRRIDQAEGYLRALGFPAVRLRIHGDVARIEVPRAMLGAVLEAEERFGLHDEIQKLGFRHVALDLAGYRMGSLNEVVEKWQSASSARKSR